MTYQHVNSHFYTIGQFSLNVLEYALTPSASSPLFSIDDHSHLPWYFDLASFPMLGDVNLHRTMSPNASLFDHQNTEFFINNLFSVVTGSQVGEYSTYNSGATAIAQSATASGETGAVRLSGNARYSVHTDIIGLMPERVFIPVVRDEQFEEYAVLPNGVTNVSHLDIDLGRRLITA